MKILLGLLLFFQTSELNQNSARALEKDLGKTLGIKKLQALNQLTDFYLDENSRKAIKYGEQAVAEANQLFDDKDYQISRTNLTMRVVAYNQLGKALFSSGYYFEAQKAFRSGQKHALAINNVLGEQEASNYLTQIDSIAENSAEMDVGFLKKPSKSSGIGDRLAQSATNLKVSTNLKIAQAYERKGNYEKAIHHFEKAAEESKEVENRIAINKHIATLLEKDGKYEEALAHYQQLMKNEAIDRDTLGIEKSISNIQEKLVVTDESQTDTGPIKKESDSVDLANFKQLAEDFEENRDYKSSLEYYKRYVALNEKLKTQLQKQKLDSLEIRSNIQEITLLTQQKEIQTLDLEQKNATIDAQSRARQNLLIGTLLLAAFLVTLYILYASKKKAYGQLETTYNDLSITQKRLVGAEQKIKTLLKQQVSGDIADTLISGNKTGKIEKKFVCIMFLDIRGFTPFAESRTPEEIIQYQNDVFGFMIDIISQKNGIINQFLGDGFMATFGAPVSYENDCQNAFDAAHEIVETVNKKSRNGEIPSTKVGIGLHAGNVVTGNVGTSERMQYSITGNTVIMAARIEQLNKKFDSQLLISKEVHEELENTNGLSPNFIEVSVKGRSKPVQLIKVV